MNRVPVEICILIVSKLPMRDLLTMGAIDRCTRRIVMPLVHGCRLLQLVTLRGQNSAVTFLMETTQVDFRVRDTHGMTTLHYAALKGYVQVVRLLTSDPRHKPLLNAPENRQNDTPLILAARYQNEAVLQILMDNGADVNARNIHGENVLFWAAKRHRTKLTQKLLKRGADPNQFVRHGLTPLIQAIMEGYLDLATILLEGGCNVEQPDSRGHRPLVWAVVLDEPAMASLLFSHHAKVNPSARKGGERSPLVWAVMKGNVEMVQLLLRHGASVGQTQPDSLAPLMWAVLHRDTSVAELLLQNGALPDEPGIHGEPALVWAMFNNDREMMRLLLRYNACLEDIKRERRFALPLSTGCEGRFITHPPHKGAGSSDGILSQSAKVRRKV
ncbi:unnamed protein product [Penicillium olsonii]|nr:unnamed protein product [Penicillium olsonii]CAG8258359.1 unnamed protein product [Penicillium olsonii]